MSHRAARARPKSIQRTEPRTIPGLVLWQASKLWQRHLASALKPHGIGGTEFVVLAGAVRLSQEQTRVSQSLLAAATKVDPMTVSQVMRSLLAKKLVKRVVCPGDRRAYDVVPTERGVDVAAAALSSVIRVHRRFFAALAKEREVEELLALLHKLIQANGRS